jgi:hypothetical protein
MLGEFMIAVTIGVYIAEAFSITTNPYSFVQIFTDAHDSTGEIILEMFDEPVSRVQTVEPVFVCAYPATAFAVDQGTDDASLANQVVAAEFVTHVAEFRYRFRLHEDTFLEDANPDIATIIFYD